MIIGGVEQFAPCAAAILIHESGHLVAMLILGYFPKRIKISLFEISITDDSRHRRSKAQNLFIIFLGPFFNFICFILFYLLYLKGVNSLFALAAANLTVGLFNAMPVMSLDGGQFVYLLLCAKVTPKMAEKVVDIMTFIILLPLAFLGFVVLFHSKYNFSLLFVCVYIVFSLIFRGNRYY